MSWLRSAFASRNRTFAALYAGAVAATLGIWVVRNLQALPIPALGDPDTSSLRLPLLFGVGGLAALALPKAWPKLARFPAWTPIAVFCCAAGAFPLLMMGVASNPNPATTETASAALPATVNSPVPVLKSIGGHVPLATVLGRPAQLNPARQFGTFQGLAPYTEVQLAIVEPPVQIDGVTEWFPYRADLLVAGMVPKKDQSYALLQPFWQAARGSVGTAKSGIRSVRSLFYNTDAMDVDFAGALSGLYISPAYQDLDYAQVAAKARVAEAEKRVRLTKAASDLRETLRRYNDVTIFAFNGDGITFPTASGEKTVSDLSGIEYYLIPGRYSTGDVAGRIRDGGGKATWRTVGGVYITLTSKDGAILVMDSKGGTSKATVANVSKSEGKLKVEY